MSLPESDYQILKLTDVFYREYPNLHIPQELRIRSRGTERHSASD